MPLVADLKQTTGTSREAIAAALLNLHIQHHIVVGDDGEVAVAHPFSSVPTGFLAGYGTVSAWGFCIWDALGIAAMTSKNSEIETSCSTCFKRIHLEIRSESLVIGAEYVAQFLVPAQHMWDDVRLTCSMQLAFCNEPHAHAWRRNFGRSPGSVLPMEKTWQLARRWYGEDRRLPNWRRRTVEETDTIFAELNLPGEFWHLDNPT
ncbi:MAG: alkylmercury lyase family protein [Candidatus Eremiobacteraeota bacterium]|nr:alkylmercury lyase family protein [Candidatus Eremiobacteraeota bacterium]